MKNCEVEKFESLRRLIEFGRASLSFWGMKTTGESTYFVRIAAEFSSRYGYSFSGS